MTPSLSCDAALGYLVQTLDAGLLVKFHAVTEKAIDAACAAMAPLLGAGHA